MSIVQIAHDEAVLKAWIACWREDAKCNLPVTASSLDHAEAALDRLMKQLRGSNEAQSDALDACAAYFDNRSDVSDGDHGIPEPNEEMRLLTIVQAAKAEGRV
jgi:hypothetical protein